MNICGLYSRICLEFNLDNTSNSLKIICHELKMYKNSAKRSGTGFKPYQYTPLFYAYLAVLSPYMTLKPVSLIYQSLQAFSPSRIRCDK
jgi:hypothetical protein